MSLDLFTDDEVGKLASNCTDGILIHMSKLEFKAALNAAVEMKIELVAYMARRADWPEGEMKPFLEDVAWASEKYPLYRLKV